MAAKCRAIGIRCQPMEATVCPASPPMNDEAGARTENIEALLARLAVVQEVGS